MCIERLAQLWSVNDGRPPHVDLIAPVSFGATKDRLTNGAQVTLEKAMQLTRRYPQARVAFGVFTLSPSPNLEEEVKRKCFRNPFYAGTVISTIEEAEKIRASLPPGYIPSSILVVTDQWHSRSARTVWRSVWRDTESDIRVITVPSTAVIDGASPMTALRTHWKWALVNVLRQAFLVCVPGSIRLMKAVNLHQPTT